MQQRKLGKKISIKLMKYLGMALVFAALSILNAATLEYQRPFGIFGSCVSLALVLYATYYFLKKLDLDKQTQDLKNRLYSIALGFIVLLVSNIVLSNFTGTNENQATLVSFISDDTLMALALFIAQASLIEEMIYRVLFFEFFANKYIALAVSTVFFSMAHSPADLALFLLYFSMGATLGMVRIKSGVKISIALHLLWNIFVLALILMMRG